MKKTPLRRLTPLKSRTPLKTYRVLRKVSKKQAKRDRELAKIEPPLDGRCQDCGELPDWRGLQRHHLQFRSQQGNDNSENLRFVCGKCHDKRHGIVDIPT